MAHPKVVNTHTLADLPLNRKAASMEHKDHDQKMDRFPNAHTGFLWNSDDSKTRKWRPQRITETTVGDKKMIIVSWYGRPKTFHIVKDPLGSKKSYKDRGARVSIVDVTDMNEIHYRHVLLVEKTEEGKYLTYPDMHVGGIAAKRKTPCL